MPAISRVYRGCELEISIDEDPSMWNITIVITPLDGVELITPFEVKHMKLPKEDALPIIRAMLISEACLAIDGRIVGG
ncbi:hypothetical protein ACPWR0_07415 [Pandoraea pneumonica]|uniref:Uncharacterized protein n=1 Tax=Pandoraea commovens TaxID=2508289 RepID=A0ABY5QGJ7_9BURK|nr:MULTISPECIES: hypothetical protein [Pandoraea]UVA79565.1 hypothetical protein NTU39_00510 [Pandoraea commovens]VVE80361.1 hypothetical protein PSP31120_02588 [Pandoraea sputorum]